MRSRLLFISLLVCPIILSSFPPFRKADVASGSSSFGFGISVGDLGDTAYVSDLGFGYMKETLSWARNEPSKGDYSWLHSDQGSDADNIANAAQTQRLKLLLRVDSPPSWANGTGGTNPPTNLSDFGDFLYALASHLNGKVAAYEIWNEPNLAVEWGNNAPNPELYTQMLQVAYLRIKAGDPNALVVSAGLATNGEHSNSALDDLEFIQRMYNAGVRGYFDILGSHPYGFAYPPDYDPSAANGLAFRRAEQQYAVMVANGDGAKKVWASEFGWLLDTTCSWSDRNWQKVSEQTQANYLVQAFQYAQSHWSWMGAMFVFNLDFAADYYQAGCPGNTYMCNPMRFYSITYRDNPCSPGTNPIKFRQAYWSLKSMSKFPAIPPLSSVSSLPTFETTASFVVSWSGTDQSGAGIKYYDVQSRTPGSGWGDWMVQTTATSATFPGSDGQTYYFQSRATDNANNVEAYPGGNGDASTIVDASPPATSMNALPASQTHTWFRVSWQGTDSTSGIAYFDVQYKDGSLGTWTSWLLNTTSTSGLFINGTSGHTYYFRVRATDQAGNAQPFPTDSAKWAYSTAGSDGTGLSRFYFPLINKQFSGW